MEMKEFQILSKLGEGAYGSVHMARVVKSGEVVALKTIKITPEDEGVSSTSLREFTILRNLDHPNIIKLLDLKLDLESQDPKLLLVFEFMDQDLSKMMKRIKALTEKDLKKIMKQILTGIEYMHSQKVFHRDLKPQNILFNKEGVIKIADFGLSRLIGSTLGTMSKEIETLWYRAPQLLLGCLRYDLAVDVWSVGCIFYELAEGKVMFQTQSEIGQIFEIMRQFGTPHLNQWPKISEYPNFKGNYPKFQPAIRQYNRLSSIGVDLLEKMVALNPETRITVREALAHPYFTPDPPHM